MYTLCTGWSK